MSALIFLTRYLSRTEKAGDCEVTLQNVLPEMRRAES